MHSLTTTAMRSSTLDQFIRPEAPAEIKHLSHGCTRVCVMGLGYVGLPLSILMANAGLVVTGVDIQSKVVECINQGKVYIAEGGLHAQLSDAIGAGRLRATGHPQEADVYVITVPTPVTENRVPDLSCVRSAIDSIAPVLRRGSLILIESTCPPRTTECMRDRLHDLRPDLHFSGSGAPRLDQVSIAYCPERVLPGNALYELVNNDRVVGGLDEISTTRAAQFYSSFVKGRIVKTTARTAEMCKLAENTFRDINIAYANELSHICNDVNVDPFEVIQIANLHPRVNILQPGPGVGGHCIAVDPWFLVHAAPSAARFVRMAREINDAQPAHMVRRILEACEANEAPVVACLGLTYKPDICDLRESPAVEVVSLLARQSRAQILVVEPHVDRLPGQLMSPRVSLVTLSEALQRANVVVLLVHHSTFLSVDRALLAGKHVVDTRGAWRCTERKA